MLINGQLIKQTDSARVWYLHGKVINELKKPVDGLNNADFTVFPALACAEQLGDFEVQFIRGAKACGGNRAYLTVSHKGFGPITVPLEDAQLKALYPGVKIQGNSIQLDYITLPPPTGLEAPPGDPSHTASPELLKPGEVAAYAAAAQSAKPANAALGGVPQ